MMNAWPVSGAIFTLVLAVASSYAQTTTSQRAVPVDPITAIIDAFKSHAVVALTEGAHGNEQGHAFRLSLIRDPRFPETVDDIVVEFGNARYQNLMDRFIRGEDIPNNVLRHAWEDTQPTAVWDRPIYEEFFRAVRNVNASLPSGRMLRVLLGDPPVDWAIVQNSEHLRFWGDRDPHAAEVIRREVFEKGRKALVIYGAYHLHRADLSLVELVERQNGTRVFTIWTHTGDDLTKLQPDVSEWRVPSLVRLQGTPLGAPGRDFFQMPPSVARLEEHFDALLYLGPRSQITFSEISAERCSDPGYLKMRLQRMEVLPEGRIKQANIDGLKQHCVSVTSK